MKILIISDSHGNIANLKHVMGFAKKIKCGAVVHCGDWNNLESVRAVENFNIPLYGVIGNADIAENIKRKFKQIEKIKLGGKNIGIVHDIRNLESGMRNLDIVFCGHHHKQQQIGNVVNPGALENSINFAIYDTLTDAVEFING